jgi:hypothetical protein
MDYITAQEAADKWGISRRRVQILCANGRIDGAMKKANLWLIPRGAGKPVDARSLRYNSDSREGRY